MNNMNQTVLTDNQWPAQQLEHWHPVEAYKGDQANAITPIHTMMGSFMLHEMNEASLKDFVETVGSEGLETWAFDVTSAIASHYAGRKLSDSDEPELMGRLDMVDLYANAFNSLGYSAHEALDLKAHNKVPRAEYTKHPEYQETFDDPCLFSFAMTRVIKDVGCSFVKGGDDVVLYDTAFLLAFLPAMAGLNKEQSCMNGFTLGWNT